MCDPMTLAVTMFGLQSGGAVMQHKAAGQAADAQTAAYNANAANAIQARNDDYTTTGIRMQQENQATAEEAYNRAAEARRQMASAGVAASEAGISGLSVENVLRNISGTASRDINTINMNNEWTQAQLQRSQLGIGAAATSRINSMQKGVKPSGWATAFKVGQAAIDSTSQYKTMNAMP